MIMLKLAKKKGEPQNQMLDPGEIKTEIPIQAPLPENVSLAEDPQQTVMLYPISEIPRTLKVSAASLIGTRSYQQDTLWYEGRGEDFLAVVCDGMGGLEGGELASTCAISEIVECFRQEDVPIRNVPSFFYQSMQSMNRSVCSLKDQNGKPVECGTTCVSVYLYQDRLFWFSIGDSKIYLIRDGQIFCPFKPHNYGTQLEQYLLDGSMGEEEYQEEKKKAEALTSFLGMGRIRLYEIPKQPFLLKKNDRIVLCSDGLYKAFSEEQILNILDMCCDDFSTTADLFMQAIRSFVKKPLDNVSVICISYEGNAAEQ